MDKTEQKPNLMTVPVTDENVALNVMVSFLNIAQKRGAFSIDESAKLWECIKFFVGPAPAPANASEIEAISDSA